MLFKNFLPKEALVSNRFRISSVMMILLFTIGFEKAFAQTTISNAGTYTNGALKLVLASNPQHNIDFYSGSGTTGAMNNTDISGISSADERWDVVYRIDAGHHSGNHTYSVDFIFNFPDYGVSVSPGTASNYILARRTGTSGNWTALVSGASSTTSTEVKFSGVAFDCDDDFYYTIFTLDATNSPLPVTWLTVGAKINGIKNIINWVTATEINNDRFEIERTVNGKDFERIGTIKGAGNSSQNLYYEFIDNMPIKFCAYRIKQIDHDDKFEYSPIVMPKIGTELSGKPEMVVYPNPANSTDIVIIDLKGTELLENKIQITDLYGKVVYEANSQELNNFLEIQNLPTGLYTILVDNRYGILTKKLMVKN